MSSNGAVEKRRKDAASVLLNDMEMTATQMRALIVGMPPHDLLGYIYARRLMRAMSEKGVTTEERNETGPDDLINENQFLLEYVHAVLASDQAPESVAFSEMKCTELFELSRKLRQQALLYAMVTSGDTANAAFGPNTADIEYHAKSTWVLLRGHRYQVLEHEFYRYVLAPHDDALKEIYGVGAQEIAIGFQAMTDATRSGHVHAIMQMMKHFDAVTAFADLESKPLKDVMEAWSADNPEQTRAAGLAVDDMLRGGVANISRHTKLPPALLEDLAYRRGEETEFFSPGDHIGTPYRTLPARKKPLIQLGSDYYAIDPCFTRDAGYRALLHNLLLRKPEYKFAFNERQKVMSEAAFADILSAQLPSAQVFREVYYKDPISKQWSENDTLILIEDVLFLVEAKAGAAATIASPALDFGRHAQAVQDLVVKAYKQCERFFSYLNSADEVPLFTRIDGKYVECVRVRHADYRAMFPIGLTVESFSPFSAFCKELPQIKPLLGKHAFVSLSIDDLFVLKRLLPTPGEFIHYMEVRQSVAGLRGAHLFDEVDHLGAYLRKNRFDLDVADQLKGGADMIIWDGMGHDVDRSFESENWEDGPFPVQQFPQEVLKLLGALDGSRASGWLSAESRIRDLGEEGRSELATMLAQLRKSLNQYPSRYFVYGSEAPVFIWLHRSGDKIDWQKVNDKASSAALATATGNLVGIMVEATAGGTYKAAHQFEVSRPAELNENNSEVYLDAERMKKRAKGHISHPEDHASETPRIGKKLGRNDPCPCQSGLKYKKCHGRSAL